MAFQVIKGSLVFQVLEANLGERGDKGDSAWSADPCPPGPNGLPSKGCAGDRKADGLPAAALPKHLSFH
ncbi:hypothetical protein MRX96_016456 [Rhipicephalus microplus]